MLAFFLRTRQQYYPRAGGMYYAILGYEILAAKYRWWWQEGFWLGNYWLGWSAIA
jgi:hypothetical protein